MAHKRGDMFYMGRSMVLFSMRHKRQAFSCYRGARDVMTGVTVREPPRPSMWRRGKKRGIGLNVLKNR